MIPTRRSLLAGLGAAALGSTLPRPARAAAPSQRRFLFLTCFGGWDPTRVIVPAFDDGGVDMEPDAEPFRVGGTVFVAHPGRPGTRSTLERWGQRLALVHGFMVPSVAHMACLRLVRTGAISGRPDWPAILGSATGGGDVPDDLDVAAQQPGVGSGGMGTAGAGASGGVEAAGIVARSGDGGGSMYVAPGTDADDSGVWLTLLGIVVFFLLGIVVFAKMKGRAAR